MKMEKAQKIELLKKLLTSPRNRNKMNERETK